MSGKKIVEKYKIADLKIRMSTYFDKTREYASKYVDRTWDGDADYEMIMDEESLKKGAQYYVDTYGNQIEVDDEFMERAMEQAEYNLTGAWFNRVIILHNGIMLHSSAVVVDGYAYLFSADSGTGKSTHTQLWLKHFGEKAFIINDDKPAIRMIDGEWKVYGTPWSGKTRINENVSAKLGGIVFLERSEQNWIEPIEAKDGVSLFFKQTIRNLNKEENMDKVLKTMEQVLEDVPVYKMGCNISDEAVVTAYNAIRRV